MKQPIKNNIKFLIVFAMISLAVFSGYAFSQAETSNASRVIFYVA